MPESNKLSGTVYCNDGIPIKGLEVLLYPDIDYNPENPLAINITREDGTFEFNSTKDQSYSLEVRGDLGSGRVFVPYDRKAGRLEIIYPVTEMIVILHTNDRHFDLNNIHEVSLKLHGKE